jgi:hypothetical protein
LLAVESIQRFQARIIFKQSLSSQIASELCLVIVVGAEAFATLKVAPLPPADELQPDSRT